MVGVGLPILQVVCPEYVFPCLNLLLHASVLPFPLPLHYTHTHQVADVVIYAPNSWSPQQVNDMAQLLTTSPASVFTASFLASYPDITGFEVTALSQLPALPAAGLTRDAKIGIGVGVGGGGAALLAAGTIIFVVARRRRRMAVEPRNLAGADVELDA